MISRLFRWNPIAALLLITLFVLALYAGGRLGEMFFDWFSDNVFYDHLKADWIRKAFFGLGVLVALTLLGELFRRRD